MLRKAILGLAFASFALLPNAASAQKVWRHGMVQAKSDAGFAMMAAKRGFAKKHGLDLQIVQFKGDALALKALIAGEIESYEGSPGSPMIAVSRGAELNTVGCYWPGLTYTIFTKPDVNSVKDLKGKTFAISSPGALPDLFARAVLENSGISPKDVKFAVMGADADRFRAVVAGVVGAAASSSEFIPITKKMGIKPLISAHDVTPNFLRFCTYMSTSTISSRNADAVNFVAAEIEAFRHAMADKADTIALTKEIIKPKADDPRPEYIYDEVVRLHAIDPEMSIPMDKLKWMEDLFRKSGTLKSDIDLKKFVDASVREKALAIVGPPKK